MTLSARSVLRRPGVVWLLRLAFSGILLTLLFMQVDLSNVFAYLKLADSECVLPVLTLLLAVYYVWAYQMSLALKPLGIRFAVHRLCAVLLISSFYSLVLPGNIVVGGTVSWYKLSRPTAKGAEIGALLIYLRLVDTLTLLAIGLIGVWFDPHFSSPQFRFVVGIMFVAVVLISLPFFSPAVTSRLERLGEPVANRVPIPRSVRNKAGAVWQAMKAFQTLETRSVMLLFGLSLLSQVLGVILYYMLALAVNLRLSILVIGWIRSVVGILQFIPFSISGLGVRETSVVLLLHEYGIAAPEALTYSLTIFSLTVVTGLAGGVLEAWDVLFRRNRTHGVKGTQ